MSFSGNDFSALSFWEHLNDSEKQMLTAGAVLRHFEKGSYVHDHDGNCLGMILLRAGGIRTYLLSEEGREITLYRLAAGDCCVLSAACVLRQITFESHMIAEEDCEALVVPAFVFGRLTESNIYVRCFAYEQAAKNFSAVMRSMQQLLFLRFDQRLASFLILQYNESGSREIHMTHEQIAQQISSAREVVARMLKRFSEKGLVEMKRGVILLRDLDGLHRLLA